LTVREEDFERASRGGAQSGAESGALVAQNQAQQPTAQVCTEVQDQQQTTEIPVLLRKDAIPC